MGRATVSDDGSQLITDPGSGVTKAGWGGGPSPSPPCSDTALGKCTFCFKKVSESNGACPIGKCEFDAAQKDDARKDVSIGGGKFASTLPAFSVLGYDLALKVEADVGGSLERECCEAEKRATKKLVITPSNIFHGLELQGKIWGPPKISGLGFETEIGLFGTAKFGGQAELAFNIAKCDATDAASLEGNILLSAEIAAKVEFSGCVFSFCPDAASFKPAAVGVEGGLRVKKAPGPSTIPVTIVPFVTAYVRAELEVSSTRKYQLFNVSKTWQRETIGGSLRAAVNDLMND